MPLNGWSRIKGYHWFITHVFLLIIKQINYIPLDIVDLIRQLKLGNPECSWNLSCPIPKYCSL